MGSMETGAVPPVPSTPAASSETSASSPPVSIPLRSLKCRLLQAILSPRCSRSSSEKNSVVNNRQTLSATPDSTLISFNLGSCHRLMPAALFMMTFVTVMAILIIYMDNTAMRQQQFRQNMRQEAELVNVAQDDENLITYMRQYILTSAAKVFPPHSHHPPSLHAPTVLHPTSVEKYVAQRFNNKRNGVFVELGAYGASVGGKSRTEWLENVLNWHGLIVTPNARDYFHLRAQRRAQDTLTAQACLSTSVHPKEITYQESEFPDDVGVVGIAMGSAGEEFSARVKCFPLYSFLLASGEQQVDFLSISCDGCELSALKHLPHDGKIKILIIEIVGNSSEELDNLLISRKYTIVKKLENSSIYVIYDFPPLKI